MGHLSCFTFIRLTCRKRCQTLAAASRYIYLSSICACNWSTETIYGLVRGSNLLFLVIKESEEGMFVTGLCINHWTFRATWVRNYFCFPPVTNCLFMYTFLVVEPSYFLWRGGNTLTPERQTGIGSDTMWDSGPWTGLPTHQTPAHALSRLGGCPKRRAIVRSLNRLDSTISDTLDDLYHHRDFAMGSCSRPIVLQERTR